MTGYTKLFGSIVASTIWREPNETRIVWITMLAMANKMGTVEASLPGLADMARVSVEDCQKAIEALESPDEWSRTKDHEGRRIVKVDGGWAILNHAKYRAKMGADERREYFRVKKAESRAKSKSPIPVNKSPKRQRLSTPSTQSEAEAKAEADTKDNEISAHAKFIALWTDEYPKYHEGEQYVLHAGKDCGQLKTLLDQLKKPAEDVFKFAILAWKNPSGFWCKNAATIAGFCTGFNQIRDEVKAQRQPPKPKLQGGFAEPMKAPPTRPAHLSNENNGGSLF